MHAITAVCANDPFVHANDPFARFHCTANERTIGG
jgi:hypothetical protein